MIKQKRWKWLLKRDTKNGGFFFSVRAYFIGMSLMWRKLQTWDIPIHRDTGVWLYWVPKELPEGIINGRILKLVRSVNVKKDGDKI